MTVDYTTLNPMKIANKFHCDFNFIHNAQNFNDLILFQLGEIYCDNDAVVTPHAHGDYVEVTYVSSGKGVVLTNGIAQEIRKNDVYISLPYDTHEIVSDKIQPLRYYFFTFSFQKNSDFCAMLESSNISKLSEKQRIVSNQSLGEAFITLLTELGENTVFSLKKFELLAKVMVIDILQLYANINIKQYSPPAVSSERTLYYRIINYIDSNLTKLDKLSDMAKDLSYNYVYLSRVFKKQFGKSIYEYYCEKKLELAKQYVRGTNKSVTEIAELLNYSSIYVFSRLFKSKFGVSPTAMRAEAQTEKTS